MFVEGFREKALDGVHYQIGHPSHSNDDGVVEHLCPLIDRQAWHHPLYSPHGKDSAGASEHHGGSRACMIIAQNEHSIEGETMDRDSFKERERALEEGYFRAQ